MNVLDGLPREAALFGLAVTRISGVVGTAPILWSQAPVRVRVGLVLALAFVSHGVSNVRATSLDSLEQIFMAAPGELFIGVAMGFVVRCAVACVEIAGDIMSPLLGFGAATLFDPHTQAHETPLTKLITLLCSLLLLLLGVHRVVLAALLGSFHAIPVGTIVHPELATEDLVHLAARTMVTGLRLALPVVATLLLIQLGLAFVSRAAPSLQIFSIGFAITMIAGALVIMNALPELAREIEVELSQTGLRLDAVLTAMTGG
jgi:flagellar biosynthetic protein FliR